MNRLAVRLALAIVGTTLLTVALVAIVANRAAGTEFRRYVAAGQMMTSGQELAGELATYYQRAGSWAGVANLLTGVDSTPGRGMGAMRGRGGMSAVILADSSGEIIYDNQTGRAGDTLTRSERGGALPVALADGEVAGYLLMLPPGMAQLAAPEQAVLDRINQALAAAAALALLAGSLLGVVLARTLARPMEHVAAASQSLAAGDLSQRVPVEGALETQTLGRSFNTMAGNLEQSEQLRRNLLADVAHELRTPLTVIQGNLQALLDGVYPLERAEIATIYDETRLLSRLVADLRELAQAEAGQLQLDLRPTDLAAVLRQTAGSFAPFAEAKEVNLRTDLPDALPAVLADPDRVGQIVRNLVSNGLRHAARGGVVSIGAQADQFDRKRGVRVAVSDDGPGIPPDQLGPRLRPLLARRPIAGTRHGRQRPGAGHHPLSGGGARRPDWGRKRRGVGNGFLVYDSCGRRCNHQCFAGIQSINLENHGEIWICRSTSIIARIAAMISSALSARCSARTPSPAPNVAANTSTRRSASLEPLAAAAADRSVPQQPAPPVAEASPANQAVRLETQKKVASSPQRCHLFASGVHAAQGRYQCWFVGQIAAIDELIHATNWRQAAQRFVRYSVLQRVGEAVGEDDREWPVEEGANRGIDGRRDAEVVVQRREDFVGLRQRLLAGLASPLLSSVASNNGVSCGAQLSRLNAVPSHLL